MIQGIKDRSKRKEDEVIRKQGCGDEGEMKKGNLGGCGDRCLWDEGEMQGNP